MTPLTAFFLGVGSTIAAIKFIEWALTPPRHTVLTPYRTGHLTTYRKDPSC